MKTEVITCPKCNESFIRDGVNTNWYENTSFGSVLVTKCPKCGKHSSVKTVIDSWLDVNKDERFYTYDK